jgi:hypothetical protein
MTDFNTSTLSERNLMKANHINEDRNSIINTSPNAMRSSDDASENGTISVVNDLPVVEMTPLTPL